MTEHHMHLQNIKSSPSCTGHNNNRSMFSVGLNLLICIPSVSAGLPLVRLLHQADEVLSEDLQRLHSVQHAAQLQLPNGRPDRRWILAQRPVPGWLGHQCLLPRPEGLCPIILLQQEDWQLIRHSTRCRRANVWQGQALPQWKVCHKVQDVWKGKD